MQCAHCPYIFTVLTQRHFLDKTLKIEDPHLPPAQQSNRTSLCLQLMVPMPAGIFSLRLSSMLLMALIVSQSLVHAQQHVDGSSLTYDSTWTTKSGLSGSQDTMHVSDVNAATANFTFNGMSVVCIAGLHGSSDAVFPFCT